MLMLGMTFKYFKYIILIDESIKEKRCKSVHNLLLLNYFCVIVPSILLNITKLYI